MEITRVLLVDDHEVVREGFRRMLELAGDIAVVGEATDGEEAIQQVRSLLPDVVLMDIKMPRLDGIEATRRLKSDFPQLNVVVLTFFEDEYLVQAIEAGAAGYLLKDVSKSELVEAIRAVMAGQALVDPLLSKRLFSRVAAMDEPGQRSRKALTERQIQVIRAIASGATNHEIAVRLNLSESSVKRDVRSIFAKFKVADRSQAVAEAARRNLI